MPLSPHLSIYRPQITSFSSIFGRLCGIYSYISLVLFVFATAFAMSKTGDALRHISMMVSFLHSQNIFISFATNAIFYASIFAYSFYTLSLVRHLIWDFGSCLEIKTAKIIGYGMFAMSFIITFAIFCL